ncbi:MAG TPA: hypothetical protein DCM07_10990 [Planctomycetaceae bacterium]|nr:hypothetical protein [Planctomycetaceae bacterium]
MWQKERLINIGIQSLPADVDAVAWIDADLVFQNPDWYEQTKSLLGTHEFVQLFERIEYLDPDGNVERSLPSWSASRNGQRMPGGAWAARRDAISGGIPDTCIIGGGDWSLVNSWPVDQKTGCTPGTVRHLFHGTQAGRQHGTREKILKRHHFNPQYDIVIDPKNGLWKWGTFKPEMQADVRAYFQNRKEDRQPVKPAPQEVKPAREPRLIPKLYSPVEPQKHRETFACDVILPYSQPNYQYLEDSIKSVLNQNFVRTVIHLVNDGVDEDPIGEKYSKLENVRWYQNTDRPVGPYVIYNRLFDYLESDLVANQDSDDLSLPMRLYKSIQLIQQGFDVVGGSMEQFVSYDDPSERMRRALTWKPYHYSGKVYAASPSGTVVNSTMVMKKSVYEACNGMAPWIAGADSEFYERCIQAGFKAVAMQDIVALRRLHDPSLSNDQVSSGHGSNLREEIKRMTAESIERQKQGPDHSIGGLAKHRNDNQLIQIKGK